MILPPEVNFLIGLGVFWLALYALSRVAHLDKHGLEVKPFYFMYRSKALNKTLDSWARRRRKLWLVLSNISIAFAVGLMVFSVYFLLSNLLRFIFPIGVASPVVPIIPGLTLRLYWLPYFVFAAVVVILTHELGHGIVARLENIPVLSTGILAALVFFGAFVEPDEKEFEKASLKARLRMLAVGSSTNLITALLAFLLLGGLFAAPSGVLILETVPNGPAEAVGLTQWDAIHAINGSSTPTSWDFADYMNQTKPGDTLILNTNKGDIPINSESDETGRAVIGIFFFPFSDYRSSIFGLPHYVNVNLLVTLFWLYLLALSVAIFNMFPLYPFDGERFLYYPLKRLMGKRKLRLREALNAVFLGIFAGNVILSFVGGLPLI
ncbi:MAG: site-2 protease family protein [Candidatus Bathyarchaeota archaeon]|jgi:membrane-associated protease RseP (regulator of RpoE activity)